MYPIEESFRWYMPDVNVKQHKSWGHKVKVKGIAIRGGTVSKNKRRYLKDELVRAARSLVGKPITVNHNPDHIIGHIEDAEFEGNNLEYIGVITDRKYADKMRDRSQVQEGEMDEEAYFMKWNVRPINGVSIDGAYRYNRCVLCDERFTDLHNWNLHMRQAHNKKSNIGETPRGLLLKGLSAVEPPEKPGVPTATIELLESVGGGMSQLLETVITDRMKIEEKEKMTKNVSVTPEKRVPGLVLDNNKTKLQEDLVSDTSYATQVPDSTGDTKMQEDIVHPDEPVPDSTGDTPSCEQGSHYDSELGMCVPDTEVPVEPAAATVDTVTASEQEEEPEECPAGQHRNLQGECVPDEPALEIVMPKPVSLEKIIVGEPFADYDSFADCVAKNSDKDDPEAYCASIEQQATGESWKHMFEVYQLEQKHVREDFAQRITTLTKATRGYGKDITEINKRLKKLDKQDHTIVETVNRSIDKLDKQDQKIAGTVTKTLQKYGEDIKDSNRILREMIKKVRSEPYVKPSQLKPFVTVQHLALKLTEVQQQVKGLKKDYESIIGAVDEKYKETKTSLEEYKKKLVEADTESAAETEENKKNKIEETEKLTEWQENIEHKLEQLSEYKGKVKMTDAPEYQGDTYKEND